jgi:glycosyltransferase involved in cell wall biosynthesis
MTTLRVLHLLSSSAFHGAESMTVELCRSSAVAGVECHLLSFDNRGRGDFEAARRLEGVCASVSVTRADRQYDRVAVESIRRIVEEARIDILHSHKYKTTFHALLARRTLEVALITTHHNWIDESLTDRLYGMIDRQMTRFVDVAVGVSEKVVGQLRATVAADRIRLIANGVDTDRFHPSADRAEARRRLGIREGIVAGFVGRLTPKKGVQDLLAAVATMHAVARPFLLIVGDGEYRQQLESQASALGLSGSYLFAGNRSNVRDYYDAMDLLVLPSYEEGFPMVVLEALAVGIPVLASKVGDIPKMLVHGENGWLIEAGNRHALLETLCAACQSNDLQVMGRAGRSRVEAAFSARHMALQYREAYEMALSVRRLRRKPVD